MLQVAEKRSTRVRTHLLECAALKYEVAEKCEDQILYAIDLLADCFESGGKLLLCGNGGSATCLAANRVRSPLPTPLRARD
jgi:Phosphoheptose isomerase